MRKSTRILQTIAVVVTTSVFMFGSLPDQALGAPHSHATHAVDQPVPPPGKTVEHLDRDVSIHIGKDEKAHGRHVFPQKPYVPNSKKKAGKHLQKQAASEQQYSMSYLNTLPYQALVDLLVTIEWHQIPELFQFNDHTYQFYADRDRMQALIESLEERGSQYTADDTKGIPTIVEVLRSGFFLGYYHSQLSYLTDKTYQSKLIPALKSIEANSHFSLGTDAQNEVIAALGKMIGNATLDAEVIVNTTKIMQQFNDHLDEYSADYSKGNAVYSLMQGIGYDLMWTLDQQTKESEFYGKLDPYLEELKLMALHGSVTDENAWVMNNGLYYSGHLGEYHSQPNFGNQVLTDALGSYSYLSYQYIQAAKLIDEVFGGKDANGNDIHFNTIIKNAREKYLPNQYTFDDGSLIMKTGGDVTTEKVKRLYWAAKEVKAQYHRVVGNDNPIDRGHADDVLTMIIYNNPDEYKMNEILYGYDTNNGGLYIEGQGTFFTYERTPSQSRYSLEELFRHEFTHYLQGRYVVPGLWGESPIYENDRLPWYEEGGAELFAGSTRTSDILPRKSVVSYLTGEGPSEWMTASETVHSKYGSFRFYNYAFALHYHLYKNKWETLDHLTDTIKESNVSRYDQYIADISNDRTLNAAYHDTIQDLVDSYPSLTVPQVSDDYLLPHGKKNHQEIYSEITTAAGLANATTEQHASKFFNTFTLRGTYTGGASKGEADDWKAMSEAANHILKTLSAKPWSGYKTLTAYFVNYRVDANNRFQFDLVFHGFLPDQAASGNLPPVANINGPYQGTTGQAVALSSQGSGDLDGSIVAYEWNFGDGTTSADPNPSHVYSAAGTYTITLRVTDNRGASAEQTTTATIANPDTGGISQESEPNDEFTQANGPVLPATEVTAAFDKSDKSDVFYFDVTSPQVVSISLAIPKNDKKLEMNWLLYHESDLKNYVAYPKQEGRILTGSYEAKPGRYYLYVYKYSGKKGTYSFQIQLQPTTDENLPPVASINGPYQGIVGKTVSFSSEGSHDADGSIVSYEWDFGDGKTSNEPNPSHTYTSADTFNVTLKITDNEGKSVQQGTTAKIEGIKKEDEPNNEFSQANGPLPSGLEVSGSFQESDVADVYYFDVASSQEVKIAMTNPDNLGLNWLLYHESDLKGYVAYAKEDGTGSLTASPGRYYLYVYKHSGTTGSYQITLEY